MSGGGSGGGRSCTEGQRILSRGGRSYAFQARAFFCCEWGSASEVAKAKSPAWFEVCSGQFELGVGAARSDSSRISLLCCRGLSGLSAFFLLCLSSLLAAATSAFALAWCNSGEWLWLFLALATAQRRYFGLCAAAAAAISRLRCSNCSGTTATFGDCASKAAAFICACVTAVQHGVI